MGSRSAGEGVGGPEDWLAALAWLVFRRFFGMLGAESDCIPLGADPGPPGGPSKFGLATELGGGGLKSGGHKPGIR